MLILLFIFCLFLSLFLLYIFTRHDFVLARKSLLLKEIFDMTIISYVAFFIIGRTTYLFGEGRFDLLNIIKFFYVTKFPGMLFIGGLFGFGAIVYFVFLKKKILLRIFDIYCLSLYPFFLYALITSYSKGFFIYFNLLIFLLSCIFLGIGIYSYKNYTLKDGSVTLLFLSLVSIFTIVSQFSMKQRIIFSFFTVPQAAAIGLFFLSSTLLLIHEGMLNSGEKDSGFWFFKKK